MLINNSCNIVQKVSHSGRFSTCGSLEMFGVKHTSLLRQRKDGLYKRFYKIGHGMCNNNNKKAHEYLDGVRKRDVSD